MKKKFQVKQTMTSLKMKDENPVMTLPIKKRINTELFIDKRAALYKLNGERKNKGYSEGAKCCRTKNR